MLRFRSFIIYLTVFSTGLFSLVYQTIWQRYLTFLVGADSRSSVITLTVFLTFLSVGYYLSGIFSHKIRRREILYYGLVEAVIGLWAVLFPYLFKVSYAFVEGGYMTGIWGDTLLSVLLTAIPATLMGTTLPFLTQGLSRTFVSSSRTHALIYAVNTIGACFGALLTGFYLVETFGMSLSMKSVGFLNILFAIIMILIGKSFRANIDVQNQIPASESPEKVLPVANKRYLLLVAACSGYLLIAIESYVIRLFSIATDGSIYAYPTVVTAFITAIGLGAWMSSVLMKKSVRIFIIIPVVVSMLWLLIMVSFPYWPFVDYWLKEFLYQSAADFDSLFLLRFFVLLVCISPPVVLSSMLLPFAFNFYKSQSESLGYTTGNLYAVATLATVAGGLLGGYYLFNHLDFKQVFQSHFIVLFIMSLSAAFVFKTGMKMRLINSFVMMLILTGAILLPSNDFNKNLALTFYFQTHSDTEKMQSTATDARNWLWEWFDYEEIISSSVRAEGSVSVFNKSLSGNNGQPYARMVAINGRSNSGTTGTDYQGNALLSLFPYIMTKSPKRVLIIGLGTGVTAGAIAAQEQVEHVDVCEINEAVIEQLPYFDFAGFDVSHNSKVNILATDAVKYLLRTDKQYDIIVSIPSNFWTAGVENLMTPDFYNLTKSRLATGGTYIQWVPDYDFSDKALLTLVKSFTGSFEDSSLWRLTEDDLVLMYRKEHQSPKSWINQHLSEDTLLDTMDQINYYSPNQLKLAQMARQQKLLEISADAAVHSINQPSLGNIVLDALYNPQPDYSAEKLIYRVRKR